VTFNMSHGFNRIYLGLLQEVYRTTIASLVLSKLKDNETKRVLLGKREQ